MPESSYHKREIILINVSGEDRPGLTKALTGVLAHHGITILDIGQAVIHEQLNLGMLIDVPEKAHSAPVLKDLLFTAHELGIHVRFTPISEGQYQHWVDQQGKPRYIITVLGRRLDSEHIAEVSNILTGQGLNIDVITRLSGRVPLEDDMSFPPYACIEMSVRGAAADPGGMRRAFLDLSHETGVDIAVQQDDVFTRNRRLVAFDMDSTLIQAEVIDELAAAAGAKEEVAAVTEQAMRGDLDFKESLRRRLGCLQGLDESVLHKIAESLPLTDGVERLFEVLQTLGYKTAVLSGGFMYFGEYLQQKLGIDYVFANKLEIVDGKLSGRVLGDIVDGDKKAELLQHIAEEENIDLRQVIAVGDGANDLPMLSRAGLGIAFRAKPVVRRSARHALSTVGLDAILYLMGIHDRHVPEA